MQILLTFFTSFCLFLSILVGFRLGRSFGQYEYNVKTKQLNRDKRRAIFTKK